MKTMPKITSNLVILKKLSASSSCCFICYYHISEEKCCDFLFLFICFSLWKIQKKRGGGGGSIKYRHPWNELKPHTTNWYHAYFAIFHWDQQMLKGKNWGGVETHSCLCGAKWIWVYYAQKNRTGSISSPLNKLTSKNIDYELIFNKKRPARTSN